MRLFVCHSGDFDYRTELYQPIRNSELNIAHEIFLPHEDGKNVKTKNEIQHSDIVVAEISYPSTGQGIELGWADAFNKPIIAIYKKDSDYSGSVRYIAKSMVEYTDKEDMLAKIIEVLNQGVEISVE